MSMLTIVIGSDHAGFRLKEDLKRALLGRGYVVEDLGTSSEASVDYPPIGRAVAKRIVATGRVPGDAPGGRGPVGILICGTGIGMSMVANRVPGARAALCHCEEFARLSREHNDANIIVLPGKFISSEDAARCVDVFLETPFAGGRHERRVNAIDAVSDAVSDADPGAC